MVSLERTPTSRRRNFSHERRYSYLAPPGLWGAFKNIATLGASLSLRSSQSRAAANGRSAPQILTVGSLTCDGDTSFAQKRRGVTRAGGLAVSPRTQQDNGASSSGHGRAAPAMHSPCTPQGKVYVTPDPALPALKTHTPRATRH